MGDDGREAFTAWAAARRSALVRSAFLLTGDAGRAEDLVQQALMKVAARWERLVDGNPDAYARTIIYRDKQLCPSWRSSPPLSTWTNRWSWSRPLLG